MGAIHERARYTSPLFIIDQGQLITTTYSLITGALAPDPTRVGEGIGSRKIILLYCFQTPRVWGREQIWCIEYSHYTTGWGV